MRVLFFAVALLSSSLVRAAACCGPTAGLPSLITSGEKWKVQAGFADTTAYADVGTDALPVFRRNQDRRETQLTTLEASVQVSELWQVGANVAQSIDGHVGDSGLQATREVLPETETNWGDVRAFAFSQLIFPTGRPLEEIQTPDQQASGEGRGSLAVGSVVIRRGWADDEFFSLRARRFRGADFGQGVHIGESNKYDAIVGAGYSRGNWRGGGSLSAQYETSRLVSSPGLSDEAGENYRFPVGLSVSYFFVGGAMAQVAYTDDTIVGPVRNITLGRSFAVSFAQRFY